MADFIRSLLSCDLLPANADSREDLEANLRKLYEHRLLSFRTPYAANKLQFDSQGNVVGAAVVCPWSSCGMLQVEQLALASGRVEINGKRVIIALRAGTAP